MKRSIGIAALIGAFIAPLLVAVGPVAPVQAANALQFNPGNIISDALMYDGAAMNATEVQAFLAQRVPNCAGTCLVNYQQNTPSIASSTYCAAYAGAPNERAADIIAKVGIACNISQKSIIVLLEKEQGLVTSTNPSATSFKFATGFGCPDTAACDPSFGSFFYQIYYAARQFQIYAHTPTQWNYQAGRNNNILFSPNSVCGTSSVFIQNKATAGLYIYTPYQPNAAALNNLYGVGDACSSYGNRNFWRIYSDWFGSPTVSSSLLRTADNASVYLVSGDYKYPISSMSILASLSPLGLVGYVSQRYLDGFTTSHTVGRSLRSPNGSIYFYDAGVKLPFVSCAQVVDYGASCATDGYVQLTQDQIDAFADGPVLNSVVGTVGGGRYFIKAGTKAEILDAQSQALAGIPVGMNVLSENALADLPLVSPIVRDGAFALARSTSDYSLLSQGKRYEAGSGVVQALGAQSSAVGSLLPASLAMIPLSPIVFNGAVSVAGSTAPTLLTVGGRYSLTGGGLSSAAVPGPMTQSFVDAYTDRGTIAPGSFIKSPSKADVYVVMPDNVRPIAGWGALLALTPSGNPQISVVSQQLIDSLSMGPVALTAGTLVRSPSDATVYYVNGVTSRIALSSFEYTSEAGFSPLLYVPDKLIQAYPLEPHVMTFGFSCGPDRYVAAGGQVHLVDPTLWADYPFEYVPLDQFSCMQLKKGIPATTFIRTKDGSIYQIVGGQKLPIGTMDRFTQLSAGKGFITVLPRFANTYPTGPAA